MNHKSAINGLEISYNVRGWTGPEWVQNEIYSNIKDLLSFSSYNETNIFKPGSFLEDLGEPKVNQVLSYHWSLIFQM